MTLYIKNMFCIRCKMVVRSEFEKLGLNTTLIGLGEVKIKDEISSEQREILKSSLERSGFELIDEQNGSLIEKIKNLIVELVHYSDDQMRKDLPEYLSKKLNHDYSYLANLFFEVKNTTIEHFFVTHKIERAKELLVYYKLSLTEIAFQLNYNSLASLSNQFKEVTGFYPSHFQEIKKIRNSTLRMCE